MKILSYAASLLMLAATASQASAFNIGFEWNLPGSAEIKTQSYLTGDVVGPASDDATTFDYECDASRWVYLVAKEGYKITSAQINGEPVASSMANGKIYVGKFFSAASAVKATLAPVERESVISVDVVNGADWISATFNDGYSVTLANGENEVKYDPDLEKSLSLAPANGATEFYSITLNGVPLEKKYAWSTSYDIETLTPGDKIVVRVFEGAEPVQKDCEVTVRFSGGMEDCINTIRNWTTSGWMTLEDGRLTVVNGTDLQFNFKPDDYIYTAFVLNGKDVTPEVKNNSLRFVVEDNTLLEVQGRPTSYAELDFTAYVMNPEGVILYCGAYEQNPADLSEGTPVAESITLGAVGLSGEVVMDADVTRRFDLRLSEKNPTVYVAPREGWYIYTVRGELNGEMYELPVVTGDSREFYVVARRFEGFRTLDVDVIGNSDVRLVGSSAKSSLWNNPSLSYSLHEGLQTVEFLPDYNLPLSLRPLEQMENFYVYLDGSGLTADENGTYLVEPWYPAEGETQEVSSTVTVYADGSVPRLGRVKVETTDDLTATAWYSTVRHEASLDGQFLLEGTRMWIVPSNVDCTITVNDVVVNGLDADNKIVSALNADGEYELAVAAGTTNVVISRGCGMVGVGGIAADVDPVRIYSIDGRRLRVESLSELPKGLYIIDGRKVLLK